MLLLESFSGAKVSAILVGVAGTVGVASVAACAYVISSVSSCGYADVNASVGAAALPPLVPLDCEQYRGLQEADGIALIVVTALAAAALGFQAVNAAIDGGAIGALEGLFSSPSSYLNFPLALSNLPLTSPGFSVMAGWPLLLFALTR